MTQVFEIYVVTCLDIFFRTTYRFAARTHSKLSYQNTITMFFDK